VAKIAKDAGLYLLEDCAQATGGSSGGKAVGTFGDMAIFSFQLNKNMTSGDGGMLVCKDAGLFERAFAVHDLGYGRNASGRLDTNNESCQLWGIGSRMSELTGAMALGQLRKIDAITGAMRDAKWKIRSKLEEIPGLAFRNIIDPAGDSGPFLITVYPDSDICERFTAALVAEGIHGPEGSLACVPMKSWGLHWYFNNPSLTEKRSWTKEGFPWSHPANAFASEYSYKKGALPVCDDMESRAGLLTIASILSEKDTDDIIAAFQKVAKVILV